MTGIFTNVDVIFMRIFRAASARSQAVKGNAVVTLDDAAFPKPHWLLGSPAMRVCRLVALSLIFPASLFAGSNVEGRVALPKTRAATVISKRYEIVTTGSVLSVSPPLAIVYLEGTFPKSKSPGTKRIAQKDLTFIPSLLAVQVGTRVEFPNFDDTYHSIFSFSPAKRFDLGRYRPDERPIPSEVFDKPGLVTLRCDIHEHMRGLILVLDTPYFVVSNADGSYKISGAPPGHYVLKAWIDSRTTREKPIDLKNGETAHVDFP